VVVELTGEETGAKVGTFSKNLMYPGTINRARYVFINLKPNAGKGLAVISNSNIPTQYGRDS